MKKLSILSTALLFVLLFSSCEMYQFVTLSSDLPFDERFQFYSENSEVKAVYSFNGQGGPIHLELTNKKDKPLYVDWSKCALIINDRSYTLWTDEATIRGNALEFKVNPDNTLKSITSFEGSISKQDKVTFIPPQTKIVRDSYLVCPTMISNSGRPSQKVSLFVEKGDYNERSAKKYSYSRDEAPLQFNIFLMLSEKEDLSNVIQLNSKFWASESIDARVKNSNVFMGNQFYNIRAK
jgi:hypothetical protein